MRRWLFWAGACLVVALGASAQTQIPTQIATHIPPPIPLHADAASSAPSLAASDSDVDTSPSTWPWYRRLRLWWIFLFDKPANTAPHKPIPLQPLTRAALLAAPEGTVVRMGHSSVLLKLHGKFWLTDPMFGERASPVPWIGPRRFHPPPIAIEELPPIEAVILSHDHYDHLDQGSILALQGKTSHFLAPRGVGDILRDWGVPAHKVRQFSWWESAEIAGVRLVATPTQHFSGRWLWGRNRTLWCSWAILTPQWRIFFSGDSGYFDGFRTIGDKLGPFDLTLLEAGAYNPRWKRNHMFPEQTVQAHRDLRGRWLLPIHHGTFSLAFHPWNEPPERVTQEARRLGVSVTTPRMGEPLDLSQMHPGSAWWRE
ncbi:MBL fold metallo-hydrolase [Candidatus Symbiobacter mobilis]|uniref:Zn-dependent hydrolase-like protein n=1 Tax=Candidatus Symbiobacter mobilis CR TaxID=946483 RepID=U5NCU1_9BURK|nr:MBL fold metallo-hydrolase [Candidatus Symbiobacter mobilis]AGX87984.1 Zn-dependent hydrolase-like protein [Candidatus Symbiobacter mobilis CR]